MEATKRFYQLLEDLDSAGQPYVRQELLNELVKVKKLINKLAILEKAEIESDTLEDPNKNAPLLMRELVKGFKETQNLISILHLFAMNHPIDDSNVMKFLETYFQGLFKTTLFSLVCLKGNEKSKFAKTLNQINKQFLTDSAKEIILKEIEEQITLGGSNWAKIDLSATKVLRTFFLNTKRTTQVESSMVENAIEEVFVIKMTMPSEEELMIITDCPEENILLEKYLEFDLGARFPNIFEVIKAVLDIAFSDAPENATNEVVVRLVETVKTDYVDLTRKVFIKFLQQDLVSYFNAECKLILEDNSPGLPPQKEGSTKKRIEIKIVSSDQIEITNNFLVEMRAFSAEISEIWAKLNQKYLKVEQKAFENARRSFDSSNTQSLCLDFNSNLYLVYQNIPLPEPLKKYINIGNFLYVPTTRSHLVVIGSNVEFLTKISESLQEAEKSKRPISVFERTFKDIRYQLVVKIRQIKAESKRTRLIDGFSLIFDLGEQAVESKEDVGLDVVMLQKKTSSTIRASIKKVMNFNKFKKMSQKSDDILSKENAEILRNSIISEYLPDQEPGLERLVTSSKHWIGKFSKNSLMMSPESSMFKKIKNLAEGEEVKRVATRRTTSKTGDQETKFDANYLQIYEDDDKKLKDWSLNIPAITNDLEKSRLVWFMLEDLGLITEFSIDRNTLCEFILQIKAGYSLHKNAFHNYSHGVTVMHGVHYILKNCGFAERFSGVINLGILIAGFCHDVGHRGKTNLFEINSRSDVAITYHDRGVLEQYHAAYTFRILNKAPFNILETLSPEDYKDIRKLIISCILSTDMKEHFDEVKNLKLLTEGLKQMEGGADLPHLSKTSSKKLVKFGDQPQETENKNIEWSEDDIKLITGYIVHAADLSGPTKAWDLAYYFSHQVNAEFIQQVEEEKALNLPVAPYMLNLDKPAVLAKSEINFVKFIVKPLWDTLNEFVSDAMKIASDNITDNMQHWETAYKNAIEEEEAEKKKAVDEKKAE